MKARAHERFDFVAHGVPIVVGHPGGSSTRLTAYTRDISRTGVSFFYPGFLHSGTVCQLSLPTRSGRMHEVEATVKWCRLVKGRLHLCGASFKAPLDPGNFVRSAEPDEPPPGSETPRLTGSILFLDPEELDRRLLGLYLRDTGAVFVPVATTDEGLDCLWRQRFDLVVTELNLGPARGEEAIAAFRAAGHHGPLFVLTLETDPERLRAARAAGADRIIPKPYDPAALLHAFAGAIQHTDSCDGPPIYSDLESRPGGREAVDQFIRAARARLEELRAALTAGRSGAALEACRSLKATGVGYGFAAVTEAADEVLRAIEASRPPRLGRLESVVRRLRLRR